MTAIPEKPSDEMQRLVRKIAGKAIAGEKGSQLQSKALRRLNISLPPHYQVSQRSLRAYWYGEAEQIPSHHMDRAREVALVLPIEEAIHAVETAERFLEGLRQRLASRPCTSRDHGNASGAHAFARRSTDFQKTNTHGAPVFESGVAAITHVLKPV